MPYSFCSGFELETDDAAETAEDEEAPAVLKGGIEEDLLDEEDSEEAGFDEDFDFSDESLIICIGRAGRRAFFGFTAQIRYNAAFV